MRRTWPSIELNLVAVAILLSGALGLDSLVLASIAGALLLIGFVFAPREECARRSVIAGTAGVVAFGIVVVVVLMS